MDVEVHTFLTYAIGMCVFCVLMEMAYPDDVRPAICRNAFIILQGVRANQELK